MKRLLKSFMTISALSSLIVAPLVLSAGQASAETKKGTDASYVGAGVAAGVTSGGQFYARGNVFWSNNTSAIIPELSVDVPIANRTNAYLTGGYFFVEKDGSQTPIGNRDSVVIATGIKSEVANNFLVYTNAKVGLSA